VSNASVLDRPADVFTRFSALETKRLREYVEDVQELAASALFAGSNSGWKWQLSGGDDEPAVQTWSYPGERAVRNAAVVFRPLYKDGEGASYARTMKLLTGHVADGRDKDEALGQLRDLRKWKAEALQIRTMAFNVNGEDLTPARLIDLWLHGKYLHKGNEKSDFLDALPHAAMLQAEFMDAMHRLARVFWVGRNVVVAVLSEPTLLPAAPAVA
jgi:hypothetical protein